MERVQASEWMLPLNAADREVHRKARLSLQKREEEEVAIADDRLLFGQCDPLPVEEWVPSVYNENRNEEMYRQLCSAVCEPISSIFLSILRIRTKCRAGRQFVFTLGNRRHL